MTKFQCQILKHTWLETHNSVVVVNHLVPTPHWMNSIRPLLITKNMGYDAQQTIDVQDNELPYLTKFGTLWKTFIIGLHP